MPLVPAVWDDSISDRIRDHQYRPLAGSGASDWREGMGFTHGMDAGEVETLGLLLQQKGDRLRAVTHDIDRLVHSAMWSGGDGTDFLHMWPTHRARLLQAAERVHGLGRAALNNVSEQLTTSSSLGGRPAPGGGWWAKVAGAGGSAGAALALIRSSLPGYLVDQVGLGHGVLDLGRMFLNHGGRSIQEFPWARPLQAITGGLDGWGLGEATALYIAGDGSADTLIRRGFDVGWTVAGILSPQVAAGGAAWDTGYFIGSSAANALDARFHYQDAILMDTMYDQYGTSNLTPSQAAELSRRYDGVKGFGTYVADLFS